MNFVNSMNQTPAVLKERRLSGTMSSLACAILGERSAGKNASRLAPLGTNAGARNDFAVPV
jgi:hypothetical protein